MVIMYRHGVSPASRAEPSVMMVASRRPEEKMTLPILLNAELTSAT